MLPVAVEGLGKAFGATVALDGVSVAFAAHGFTALLGPSGCGKSTLLRLIAGLERPSAGAIRIGETDVTSLPPEARDVGMMFQSYALFPHMSVQDNVAFPLRMKRTPRDETASRVREALALVRLEATADRSVRALSGGQQQRVALARAFVARPGVLLLDEPLSNLDARLRDDMQVELIDLHRTLELTTIFVTHDQEEALSLADTVVLMRAGRIEQIGRPEEIYAAPATAFAADFIGAANLLPAEVRRAGDGWTAEVAGETVPVPQPRGGREGAYTLMLRQEDLSLASASDMPGAPGAASLPARVRTRVYLGSGARIVVEAGSHTLSLVTDTHGAARAGDAVRIVWDPARSRLLDPS